MILGLRTAAYPVPDLAAGKRWYAEAFDVEPYFDEPFYVGFSDGGFELGLMPDGKPGHAGVLAYWGVEDVAAEADRLTRLGASVVESPHDVGGEIIVATVADPWGNHIGLIRNLHFQPGAVR
jgi:predicted enzyme related to lactoylglutathione lyase